MSCMKDFHFNNVPFLKADFFLTVKPVSTDDSEDDSKDCNKGESIGANQKHVLYISFTVFAVSVMSVGIAAFCLAKTFFIKR